MREKSTLIHLVIEGENITTTEEHPFYIKGEGFVEAKELEVGGLAENAEGESVLIESVDVEYLEEPITVYNFEVADYHTYYVGDMEVLVHNTCAVGGAYKDVPANGGQRHHMPVDSVSPYSKGEGPVIVMDTVDHMETASWGNSKKAQEYRKVQEELVQQGDFKQAQQMDIDDIKTKFGNKYNEGIIQMEIYTDKLLKGEK